MCLRFMQVCYVVRIFMRFVREPLPSHRDHQWVAWHDTAPNVDIPADASPEGIIVQTSVTACQDFFMQLFLAHSQPVLFVGPTGTGKSAIVNDVILKLPKEKWVPVFLNFSAQTSSTQTQDVILSKLDRRRKGVSSLLLFVSQTYATQPHANMRTRRAKGRDAGRKQRE